MPPAHRRAAPSRPDPTRRHRTAPKRAGTRRSVSQRAAQREWPAPPERPDHAPERAAQWARPRAHTRGPTTRRRPATRRARSAGAPARIGAAQRSWSLRAAGPRAATRTHATSGRSGARMDGRPHEWNETGQAAIALAAWRALRPSTRHAGKVRRAGKRDALTRRRVRRSRRATYATKGAPYGGSGSHRRRRRANGHATRTPRPESGRPTRGTARGRGAYARP